MSPSPQNRWPSPLSLVVFVAGLIAAAASGVATYRSVGLYGGPVMSGFHREWDPDTKRYRLIHETTMKSGTRLRTVMTDDLRPEKLTFTPPAEVRLSKPDESGRVPFSTAKDGVIDAWATRDPLSGNSRIEVSTNRDGQIDRWEYYEKGRLTKVELDTNGNGKADRWMMYEDGILMNTFVDVNEDGQPDGDVR